MNFPQVFAAGFPRCGTTFIGVLLSQHPELNVPLKKHPVYPYPVKKEIHYFNKFPSDLRNPTSENLGFNRNITEYCSYFDSDKINFDLSICSAYDRDSAVRVKEVLGDVKILFFVRNKEDHKEALKILTGPGDYPYLSEFDMKMAPYFENFSNIMTIDLEETKKDPEGVLKKILIYAGVKDIDFKFDLNIPHHSSKEMAIHRSKQ